MLYGSRQHFTVPMFADEYTDRRAEISVMQQKQLIVPERVDYILSARKKLLDDLAAIYDVNLHMSDTVGP